MAEFLLDYWVALFAIVIFIGIVIGIVMAKRDLFPISYYREIRNRISPRADASKFKIQITRGDSPLDLKALDGPEAQSITAEFVTDFDAALIADPFLFKHEEKLWLFFEAVDRVSRKGIISAAFSEDGNTWTYHGKVLEESFHMSYPQVFEQDGVIWMIPETAADLSVRLYKANSFPDDWELHSVLLKGHIYCDSTVFRHDQKWMMFSADRFSILNLYFADKLTGPWIKHPCSPIVHRNLHNARCGGRVIRHSGELLRIAQDCKQYYGHLLRAFKITELDEKNYKELEIENSPILTPRKGTWRPFGCHHLETLEHDGRWLIAADGF